VQKDLVSGANRRRSLGQPVQHFSKVMLATLLLMLMRLCYDGSFLPLTSPRFGIKYGRLKTGTPPRLDLQSLDVTRLAVQHGDVCPQPFSFRYPAADVPIYYPEPVLFRYSRPPVLEGGGRQQLSTWLTRTSAQTEGGEIERG
jgi:hypothetical protein